MAACFDSVLEKFRSLNIQPGLRFSPMRIQIQTLQIELRFLKMFSLCLTKSEGAGNDVHPSSVMIDIEAVLKEAEQGLLDSGLTSTPESKDWDPVASNLLEKIQHFKPEIREVAVVLLDCSFKSKSCNGDEILELIDSTLKNLEDLVNLEAEILVAVKKQIRALEKHLSFVRNFVDFTTKCIEGEKLEGFLAYMHDWVKKAACLSLLYWLEGKDENKVETLENMLSKLLGMIKPNIPQVTGMLAGILKASKSSRSDKILIGRIVASLVDFLLEDLMVLVKDCIEILHDGVIFLITFLMHPPEEAAMEVGNVLLTQVDAVLNDVVSLICSFYSDEKKEEISSQMKICLSSYEAKSNKIKAEVKELYFQIPNSSLSNFPATNGIGFVDYFLENLEAMLKCNPSFISFAKHKVVIVQGGLQSLRPFLNDMMELANEHEETKELCKQIINVAYRAQHAINSCSVTDSPIWYNLIHLSYVIEEMELIKLEVKKANDQQTHNIRTHDAELISSHIVPVQANASKLDDIVVGFKDEAETIIDRLKRGSSHLDIVSIVGMPGLGKTSLAKKVYDSVKYQFNRRAWCCISQVYSIRELMLDILSDLNAVDARLSYSNTTDHEDLVEHIWKSLKGRKYLIVMDDIWDISAWDNLKRSLPDDENGSRIMFTSRIHNLVSQAKPNCSPHPLRSLSDEESWELLEAKVFDKDGCPEELTEVGKRIAKNCKGLPLAVVLVAGILARTKKNLHWWTEVEGSMGSKISNEGCMDILELSYKHLPNCLRPCFLYFAAFPEDRSVGIQKLMKLWIAEGFIPKTQSKSLDNVAEEYLKDLIGRSLVIIAKRSSNGGIKECRVHDLVHDLCLAKVKEDKFLQWIHEQDVSHYSSDPTVYNQYRLCIDSDWSQFIKASPAGPLVNSLCLFGNYKDFQRHSNPSSFFHNFRFLKVLDLECLYLDCCFPSEITLINHLRYLALLCSIRQVPSSIANLWNLETFIFKSVWLNAPLPDSSVRLNAPLPDSFWKLKNLRHVDFGVIHVTNLIDFRHDESFQLDNIVTFSMPIFAYGRESEELMRRLPRLKKLYCFFFEPQYDPLNPIIFPRLSSLSNLESLKMLGSRKDPYDGENRDQFRAFDLPNTLRKLTLGRLTFPWSAISIIGQLPNLEILKLRGDSFSGPRWDVEDGEFLKLKHLELCHLDIQEWNVSCESFLCLERLVVRDCSYLQEIPSCLGEIATLKKMEVRWCYNAAASARQILEEQQDMGNDGLEVLVVT